MTKTATTNAAGKQRTIAIVVMFFLFAMIAFVTNLAAPIGTIWGFKFEGNSFLGMLGNMMNFLAYLIMGIPAGRMLQKIGYKKTALCAIGTGILGLLIQWMSSLIGNGEDIWLPFSFYLGGAFISGFCVCMLNTVVNPMLNLLGGGGNKGNQLIQMGGTLNSLSATLTPFLVGALIGTLTKQTSISDVVPLLWIAIGIFAVTFIIISIVAIPEPNGSLSGKKPVYEHSVWNFRHTVLGVIGIFFYVGIEIGIPGTLNFYLSNPVQDGGFGLPAEVNPSKIAGTIVAIYWLFMLVGRFLSSAISGAVSARTQMITVSSVAIVFVVAGILTPTSCTLPIPGFLTDSYIEIPVTAYLFILCGLCTSVMWGTIFNLAVEGIGKYTAQASGIFMMMVVGGGIMPQLQQLFARSIGYIDSYWLVVGMLGYLLFYSLSGSKNVNKDIPVSEEEILQEKSDAV